MYIISPSDCIRCCFSNNPQKESEDVSTKTEVFFAETVSIDSWFSYLKNYITNDEQLRADKFYSDADRKTYISCHAILRLILSARLNINPLDLAFINGPHGKPGFPDNQAFFNIAHTRDAFAIAFAGENNVGIDLEKIRQRLDIRSIIKTYFSIKEQNYIQRSKSGEKDTFFKLWTRKEALLKALGTGITINLKQVEVSGPDNFIEMESFANLNIGNGLNEYYIYSLKMKAYYLSIAIPNKSSISFFHLDKNNLAGCLDK